MPALGMAQETGTLLQWFKTAGDPVTKGEPLMEIETDKATVEIEAPASGILARVTAQPGDVIPVGERIALILAPGESEPAGPARVPVTPVAARLAAEHNLDLNQVAPQGEQIRKEDVLAYLARQRSPQPAIRVLASPKARRLAREHGIDLASIAGSGPGGAVLFSDVQPMLADSPVPMTSFPVSRVWRVMVDRLSGAWSNIPHFYLMRDVNASRLVAWRSQAQKNITEEITYTDLLIRLTAVALRRFPRLNASWQNNSIVGHSDINIGLAVAAEEGLLVPVIHHADEMDLRKLAARRRELVARARSGKLSLDEMSGGTFTISNLGMYGVDAFVAIVNPPQAAILAVSRISDRVVPVNGAPAVQPIVTLTLSCDHRVVDGARGAQFLQALADLVEEPLQILH